MPKEGANPLIEDAYKAILNNYPDCYANKEAAYKLAGMMLDKGDKAGAIKYYRKFLELADADTGGCANSKSSSQGSRIDTAKAKLAELTAEGGNN